MERIPRVTTFRRIPYRLIILFFSCISVAMVVIVCPQGGVSHRLKITNQEQERKLKHRKWSNEPIRIIGVKAKGQTIRLEEKILGNDDWFHRLTIKVKNVSNKNIVFVELELDFLRPGSSTDQAITAFPLISGTLDDQPPRILKPGDSWELSLSDEDYDTLIKRLSISDYPLGVKDIEITTSEVIFADNTRWVAGETRPRPPAQNIKTKPNQSKHRQLDSFKSPVLVPRRIFHISYPTSFSFGKFSATPTEKNAPAEPDLPQCGNRSDAPPVVCYRDCGKTRTTMAFPKRWSYTG